MLRSLVGNAEARVFINSIQRNPRDTLTRGAFADWLNEHAVDYPGATEWAELIRLQFSEAAMCPRQYFANEDNTSERYIATHRRIQELIPQVEAHMKACSNMLTPLMVNGHLSGQEMRYYNDMNPDISSSYVNETFVNPSAPMRLTDSWYIDSDTIRSFARECAKRQYIAKHGINGVRGENWGDPEQYGDDLDAYPDSQDDLGRFKAAFPNADDLCEAMNAASEDELRQRVNEYANIHNIASLDLLHQIGHMGGQGVERLADLPFMPNVHSLDLYDCDIDKRAIRAIGDGDTRRGPAAKGAKAFERITTLNLGGNGIVNDGLKALNACKNLKHLTSLNVRNNALTHDAINILGRGERFRHLATLKIDSNHLGDQAIDAFAHHKQFESLQTLDIGQTDLSQEAIRHLAECKPLRNLLSLDISSNDYGLDDVIHIGKSGNFNKLQLIKIHHNNLMDNADPSVIQPLCDAIANDDSVFPSIVRIETRNDKMNRMLDEAIAMRHNRQQGIVEDALITPGKNNRGLA